MRQGVRDVIIGLAILAFGLIATEKKWMNRQWYGAMVAGPLYAAYGLYQVVRAKKNIGPKV